MWGTDMTTTLTVKEGSASVFFAIDHCSLEIAGIHAAKRGTRFEALEVLRQGVIDHFSYFSADAATGLKLRHDHGSQLFQTIIKRNYAFLLSRVRRLLSVNPRATVLPNALLEP